MLRRPSVRSAATTLAAALVLVAGADLASYAATGKSLIVGHGNSAGKTTTLKNTGHGPALSLSNSKSAPPLAVSSSKMVKHLNAEKVGGKTAGQLSPALTTYRLGRSGGVLTNDVHYFTAAAPAGDVRVSITGIWTSGTSTDAIQCIAVNQKLMTDPGNYSYFYGIVDKSLSASPDAVNIDSTQYVHIGKGQRVLFGCSTSGDTGPVTVVQPITFTFQQVSPQVKHGTPATPRSGVIRGLGR